MRASRTASFSTAARATAPPGPPTRFANEHGFESVASIIGGAKLWSDLGFPVEGEITVGTEESETDLEDEEDD